MTRIVLINMAEVYGSVFEIKVAFRKLHSCDKETH